MKIIKSRRFKNAIKIYGESCHCFPKTLRLQKHTDRYRYVIDVAHYCPSRGKWFGDIACPCDELVEYIFKNILKEEK